MKSKFINVLVFAAGAAIGSAVTWKVMQTKYNKLMQEEIDSIKDAFAGFDGDGDSDEVTEESSDDDDGMSSEATVTHIDWSEYEDLDEDDDEFDDQTLDEYSRIAGMYTSEKGGVETMVKDPYVISPYDFGELDNYRQFELTYYADGTLEDEDYNIVTDIDELIGPKALTTFGEYEDDAVFVRNERLKADFQILKDYRTYEEARSISPNQVDDE